MKKSKTKSQKQSRSSDYWIILERNADLSGWPNAFGPFTSPEKAIDFCNARVEMLANEWVAEDGILTDQLQWKLEKCCFIE